MSRLDEAAKRVSADPAPADEEVTDPTEDLDPDANAAGDADNDEGEPGDGKERTAENVRREVLRKMEKSQKEMMEKLADMAAENKALRTQSPAAPTVPDAPRTFDDMSVVELIQAQPSIAEKDRAAFDAYLIDRKVDEKIDKKLGKFEKSTNFAQQEDKFNQMAYDRWPDLHNKSSEFYGIADKILSEMGKAGDDNPRAVLDASNEAGLELGVAPSTGLRNTRRSPGNVAPGRSTKGTDAPSPEATAEDQAIAGRLQNAMPGKKFTKAQLKRIAKRSAQYKAQINSHLRG